MRVLLHRRVAEAFRTAAVDLDELAAITRHAMKSGSVVSVMDGAALGGCKFDVSDEGSGLLELLVTCWGMRASTADRLHQRLPGGHLFWAN